MKLEQQTNNKNNINYFIQFLKSQDDLQEQIQLNPDETPEEMWNYIFEKIREEVKASSYCDDGTLVLKYAKEYLDDYKIIKEHKAKSNLIAKEEKKETIEEPKEVAKQEISPKLEVLKEEPKEIKVKQEKTPKKANKEENSEFKQMSIFDF